MTSPLYGAIEAGGTKFVCAAANGIDRFVAETRIATTAPAETLRAVEAFFGAIEATHGPFAAFGIATFGPVDLRQGSSTFGHILDTPKPGWSRTDLVAPIARRFGAPVAVDTDVNAAALAESLYGAGRGCDPVVYFTVGTGIGGGAVVGSRTLKGLLHPEMGHVRVRRDARDAAFPGICPFHGDCVEGLASGAAIVARYGRPLDQLPSDHEAHGVIGHYLGQLAAQAMLMLAPDRIVFGGGVLDAERLLGEIRRCAARTLNGYAGLGSDPHAFERLIVSPELAQRSGIVGAVVLAQSAACRR